MRIENGQRKFDGLGSRNRRRRRCGILAGNIKQSHALYQGHIIYVSDYIIGHFSLGPEKKSREILREIRFKFEF